MRTFLQYIPLLVLQVCSSCQSQDLSRLVVVEGRVLSETYDQGNALEDASVCFSVEETVVGKIPTNRVTAVFAASTADVAALAQAKTLILMEDEDPAVRSLMWRSGQFQVIHNDASLGFVPESFRGQEEKLRTYLKSLDRKPIPKQRAVVLAIKQAKTRFKMGAPRVESVLRDNCEFGWDIAISDMESSFLEHSRWVFIGDDGKYKGPLK